MSCVFSRNQIYTALVIFYHQCMVTFILKPKEITAVKLTDSTNYINTKFTNTNTEDKNYIHNFTLHMSILVASHPW